MSRRPWLGRKKKPQSFITVAIRCLQVPVENGSKQLRNVKHSSSVEDEYRDKDKIGEVCELIRCFL